MFVELDISLKAEHLRLTFRSKYVHKVKFNALVLSVENDKLSHKYIIPFYKYLE